MNSWKPSKAGKSKFSKGASKLGTDFERIKCLKYIKNAV